MSVMSVDRFEFKIAGGFDMPAIWFNLREKEIMIFPLKLYGVFWDCYEEHQISQQIRARFQLFPNEVYGIYFDDSCGSYWIKHERSAFIDSAIAALKDLCEYVIAGGKCIYNHFTTVTAQHMLAGIDSLRIPKNYSQIFYEEICVEDFSFKFIEPYSCDTRYEIKIGNRSYVSSFSDWATDFNRIRNEIEAFVISSCSKKREFGIRKRLKKLWE